MIPCLRQARGSGPVVQGYFSNYYAVPGNLDSMGAIPGARAPGYWGQALKRRSQRHRYAWVRRLKLAAQWLPLHLALCSHPWPLDRFFCRHSSKIGAACANERSCGSVRGAISNDRPYRDLIDIGIASRRPSFKVALSASSIRLFPKCMVRHLTAREKF